MKAKLSRHAIDLGSRYSNGAFSIAIPSRHATRISVCLFDGEKETKRVALTKTGDVHAGVLADLKPGNRYGLRAEGPWAPDKGHRFDPSKLLVDPYATELDRPYAFHPDLCVFGRDTAALVPKAKVAKSQKAAKRVAPRQPEWIYEVPVRAYSMRHPDVPERLRGTVAALAHPATIAHLKRIGAETIELMPMAAWIDERHLHRLGLRNAWGYNPVAFFAPEPRLAPGGFAEIAETVKVLHAHGFQVIVDVVLNHTGESDTEGPTLSFRGLDHRSWYAHDGGALVNDTGCGNTVALNDGWVTDYAVAALRHWVEATGIDGFRFDLATVMGRTPGGFSSEAPLLKAILADPVLSSCILIAEPWDVGPGGYQLGKFPQVFLEWNDKFRDDVRRFWRGDAFGANALATRLAGSSDVFQPQKSPRASINFIAAHDGFTLADFTRYTKKDNFANGEDNRDGKSDEVTVPGGNAAALLATLFLARGTPLLTAGDEFGRSQNGNNNAYAQDNETTWLDWTQADQGLIDTVSVLTGLRKRNPLLGEDHFLTGDGDAEWFDATGAAPDWTRPDNPFLGLRLSGTDEELVIAVNRSAESAALPVQPPAGFVWERLYPAGDALLCPARSASLFAAKKA